MQMGKLEQIHVSNVKSNLKKPKVAFALGAIIMTGFFLVGVDDYLFNVYTLLDLNVKGKILPTDCYGLDSYDVNQRDSCTFFKFQTNVDNEERLSWEPENAYMVWEVTGWDNCIRKDYYGSSTLHFYTDIRGSECLSYGFTFDTREWNLIEDDTTYTFTRS